jgi:hypothetical protein
MKNIFSGLGISSKPKPNVRKLEREIEELQLLVENQAC